MNEKKIRPIGNWVLVRREDDASESIGGIAIPDTAKMPGKPGRGIIVAVGRGAATKKGERLGCSVDVGARVVFSRLAGYELQGFSDDLVLVDHDDLMLELGQEVRVDAVMPTSDGGA